MNQHDEELQNNLESGLPPKGDPLDVKAYQAVFQALKKEPGFSLPPDFARRVASRVAARQGGFSRDYFWFGAGIFFLVISFVATVLYTGFRLDFGFLKPMADYQGLALFGIAFIILLNWLDRKLVKERQTQQRV